MPRPRPYRAVFVHSLKVWAFMVVTGIPVMLLANYLPRWLFVLVFFAYGIFILAPVVFGIGPIGRFVGRELNESSVAQARQEREALGAKKANSPDSRQAPGPD
jgi:hypothetical protein